MCSKSLFCTVCQWGFYQNRLHTYPGWKGNVSTGVPLLPTNLRLSPESDGRFIKLWSAVNIQKDLKKQPINNWYGFKFHCHMQKHTSGRVQRAVIASEDCPGAGTPKRRREAVTDEGPHSCDIKQPRLDLFPLWAGLQILCLSSNNSTSGFVQ